MKYLAVFFLLFLGLQVYADDFLYILNDNCINSLYNLAKKYITNPEIEIVRDSYGIILRFGIINPYEEYEKLSESTVKKLTEIQYFLAKIQNSAIIEVRTADSEQNKIKRLKNWELSAVIANNAESIMLKSGTGLDYTRIKSVGFGEFIPEKNTPYNGGKYSNRVDIIILCNISGE